MIPHRFVTEYPERCLELIDEIEPVARGRLLLGSFSLLAAAAVFTIPYERARARHFLAASDGEEALAAAIAREERKAFSSAAFWQGPGPADWRLTRIVSSPDATERWKDADGRHPFDPGAANAIERSGSTGRVLRVVRNALAHGNIIYLDEDGRARPDRPLNYLTFLSRYEETAESAQSYRVVITTQDEFMAFVRAWARWLSTFPVDGTFQEGPAG